MDADILKNLTDPAILFFFLGVTIGLIRSNLEIPAPIAKFLSLYLLMALGFKGGQALADAGLSGDGVKVIGAAIVLALVIPVIWFLVLRKRIDAFDAAAIAATYGSVSAVTFVTASPLRSASRSRSTSRSVSRSTTRSLLRSVPERANQSVPHNRHGAVNSDRPVGASFNSDEPMRSGNRCARPFKIAKVRHHSHCRVTRFGWRNAEHMLNEISRWR